MVGTLKTTLGKILEEKRAEIKTLLVEHGDKTVADVKLEQIFSGSRGIRSLYCDTSSVPPEKGLLVRGIPIGELASRLPQEILYLLLTGKLPNEAELKDISDELKSRSKVPEYVWDIFDAMPKDAHPMCMLNAAILSLQGTSVFAKQYSEGLPKEKYWEATLEDGLNLIAQLPVIAAAVYRKRFNKGPRIEANENLNWGNNFAAMLGVDDPTGKFAELMNLYLVLHCDHGGGNVSANTAATVNSALSDLYYSLSAGLNGLAGPLHGLANQECLKWVQDTMDKFGGVPTVEQITNFTEETLAARRVIPGYGHAVLRVEDPRFTAFVNFGKENCPNNDVFKTVQVVYEAVPKVLMQHPKIKNPWPNVDAASGSLLTHFGLIEKDYYTVLFSVSRALGICTQAILNRGLGQPIVRPSAVTTKWIENAIGN